MKQEEREKRDAYYRDAASWADDRTVQQSRSTRTAWTTAGALGLVAVLEAIAIMTMMPLKTVVPYTLLVDKQTGYVQALDPIEVPRVAPDTALTQSFLVQYVIAREGYDADVVKSDYRKVASWTGKSARNSYINAMQISNPESPLAKYPRSTVVEARVKSVSPVNKETALVRFDTIRKDANGREYAPQPWVATMGYRYSGEPLSVEERFLNPLGFEVIKYRRDPEALPVVASPVAQSSGDESPMKIPPTNVPAATR